jgi:hypothetical protein
VTLSDLGDDEIAKAIGYVVVNSTKFEAALERSLALLIHGPQWRPVEDVEMPAGFGKMTTLESIADPVSVEILLRRVQLGRRVEIMFEILERWWPDSKTDSDVQKIKSRVTLAVSDRNLVVHGYQQERTFQRGHGAPRKLTPAQINRTAEALHRLAYLLEGRVYGWLGQATTPP